MYRHAVLPLLARVDPETVHDWTLRLLAGVSRVPALHPLLHRCFDYADPRLHVDLWGLHFRNPLGVAAGLDKNGRAVAALLALGWGHVEVGTVTPLPQAGNPRPRIFRLANDRGLINRMGFPGQGAEVVAGHLARRSRAPGIVGANIGANKNSVEAGTAATDYALALERLYDVADYLTINVSSPNTAGLRDLEDRIRLARLVESLMEEPLPATRARPPLVVKLS
ncbi:MAG: dihydroorotate dehydrogenase (quinone), partial [Chloroflexota bacterium]|nr:dihydroorotate dehydrogenase (quinone) [Chloroflexota bacterium]